MFSFHPIDRLKFFIERQFVKGARYQFLAAAVALATLSLIGGLLVLGTNAGDGLAETVWWAFLRLSDPGYLGDDHGLRQRLVSAVLTFSGYVLVLGTVVAILTRWLISFMRQLERGLTPVTMKDHIVVLGWTDRTIPVLRDILLSTAKIRRFLARRGRKKRVRMAVLAEDVTSDMAHELRMDPAIEKRMSDVVLRSGSALDVRHLERVASLQSAAIILPTQIFDEEHPITSDVETIKTLLSLEGLSRSAEETLPYVVAELQDTRRMAITRRAYSGPLEVVAGDEVISELMVQTIHHPGLSRIYNELLSPDLGNEVVIHAHPQLSGRTFDEIAPLFDDVILCGIIRKRNGSFTSHLNPAGDFTVEDSDQLVFIAPPNSQVEPKDAPATPESTPEPRRISASTTPPGAARPRQILILGWSQKVVTMLREFTTYQHERVEVTVMSTFPADERIEEIKNYGVELPEGTCRHVDGDYTVESELDAVDPAEFESVILMSSDRMSAGEEADARTIGGYLCLQEVIDDPADHPHVLVELADAHNRELLGEEVDEVIISPLLVSHILAQVAMHRGLRRVLVELFTADGAELVCRNPSDYEISDEKISFGQLKRRARRFGETLVGINDEINPPVDSQWSVGDADRFIALTTMTDGG